jgi:hypothetical protein
VRSVPLFRRGSAPILAASEMAIENGNMDANPLAYGSGAPVLILRPIMHCSPANIRAPSADSVGYFFRPRPDETARSGYGTTDPVNGRR